MICENFREPNSRLVYAENSPSEYEAVLDIVAKHSSDGIFIVEPASDRFRFAFANETFLQMQLLALQDIAGLWLHECLPEAIANIMYTHLTHCLGQQAPCSYQQSAEAEGSFYSLLITLCPVTGNSGRITKIVGICRDMTERQRSRAAANLLQTITLSVAESQDFEAALTVTLQKICQVTGWNYGEAWIPNPEGTTIELSSAWYGVSSELESFRARREGTLHHLPTGSNHLIGQVWSVEHLSWATEYVAEPIASLLQTEVAIATGFKAGLAIPILVAGKTLAVLVFFMTEPRLQDRRLIALISAVTVQLGLVIHHKKYRHIFENAVAGIYQASAEGRYQMVNPMLARIYGYDSPQDLMTSITDMAQQVYVNPSRREEFQQILEARDAVWGFESEIYRKDGSIIWISENARAIRDDTGEIVGYEGTVEDITQRKIAEAELHKRESLLQGVATAMHHLLTDADRKAAILKALATLGAVTAVERVYIYESHPHPETGESALSLRFEWIRASREASINRPDRQNLIPSDFGLTHWSSLVETHYAVTDFVQILSKEERDLLEREGLLSRLVVPIRVNNQLWGYLGFDDGISSMRRWSEGEISILMTIGESIGGALQRQQIEEWMRHQALHDRLTGLPNRIFLNDQLNLAIQQAHANGQQLAIMFLDLDHFKCINDSYGHAIGDLLLQVLGKRLTRCLREGDIVARWGGDEFIILLPHISRPIDAAHVAQRILEALHPPFDLDGHQLSVRSSIGIAVYPTEGEDIETLMKKADEALYRAKEEGRNGFRF